ncbi:MAG: ABC transporter permease subunit [Candidatus Limnocylindria bacterium]
MSWRLFRQTLYWNRVRLVVVLLAAFGWGILIPVFYVSFSEAIREIVNSGAFPRSLMSLGSGNLFSLPGALTLGLQHPFAIALVAIFAVATPAAAVAGERERGTLEVLLSRPISRLTHLRTVAAAVALMLVAAVGALLAGQLAGMAAVDVIDQLAAGGLWLVLVNGALLWFAFAAFGLAASVSFDRHAPALGLSLGYLLANYLLEVLGSLWTDVAWSQEYSLFHHFNAGGILQGDAQVADFLILAGAVVLPLLYAVVVYPRRDLAAPT